jgi:hypothetical protein
VHGSYSAGREAADDFGFRALDSGMYDVHGKDLCRLDWKPHCQPVAKINPIAFAIWV